MDELKCDWAVGTVHPSSHPWMKNRLRFITYFRVQRNLGMAASDFVAPLLTGEKKDGGPPGLLGTKSVHPTINMLFTEQCKNVGGEINIYETSHQ